MSDNEEDKKSKKLFKTVKEVLKAQVLAGRVPLDAVLQGNPNQQVLPQERNKIRKLGDFDLTMLISEIHDHGWPHARRTLKMMPDQD